ncbi:MAG TPA: PVC-type heme-binding CxxCH protein [Pirellulales bacterium]|jgi:putative membrane-bound dehydrogenase-like protein
MRLRPVYVLAIVLCAAPFRATATEPTVLSTITVPDGYEIEMVAGPPLVEHPTMAGFDERGRLFVADNAGVNFPAEELLAKLPNGVRMLEDTNGDGRFDKSTLFADKMTFPMGALAHRGSLYVASPPYIWKITDTDGDGRADRREPIVGSFGFIGNAADIHGCFLGPEGRIYWCDGRHGHNFVDAEGKPLSKGLAARVFSCRPDGSDVEVFCGGGMDNPVEVCFTEAGDMIGTMTFYNPDEQRRDALVHFVYGGVYPRKHDCTAEFKRTGDLLPALSLFDVVAPSGVTRYRGVALGDDYRDNLFSVQFNTHKVLRHQLSPSGGTFRSQDTPFLTSTNIDFHPTDVLEDADGSLLVIDTGGWFRIGCPTSQTAKPEIGGAIYRVRKKGAKRIDDPRGLKLAWSEAPLAELVDRLDDPRSAVRDRAVEELGERKDAAAGLADLLQSVERTPRARRNAVWALARAPGPKGVVLLAQTLKDPDASVRQAAAISLGSFGFSDSASALCEALSDEAPSVRREAASALARLAKKAGPNAAAVLLKELNRPNDRFLEHALIFALIRIDDPAATRVGLEDKNPDVRRAALVALDQMDSGGLKQDEVAALLNTADAALAKAALDVITRHPGWAGEIVDRLAAWLREKQLPEERADSLRGALLAFAGDANVQSLVAESLSVGGSSPETRRLLLDVIAEADLRELPSAWQAAARSRLSSTDRDELLQAVSTTAKRRIAGADERLLQLAADDARDDELRVAAAAAVAQRGGAIDNASFNVLASQLGGEAPSQRRLLAADALGLAKLTAAQQTKAVPLVADAGPLELAALLQAFATMKDEAVGLKLVDTLSRSAGAESLSPTELAKLFESMPARSRQAAQPLIDRLKAASARQSEQLQATLARLEGGDAAAGRAIFFGRKATCSACHRAAGEGGKIGPDLSKIGEIRAPSDLAESILIPSASIARGYESFAVSTNDGQVHTGLIVRETPTAIYLLTPDRNELRVDRRDVESLQPSRLSIMPEGLDRVLSPDELRDLIAFLRTLK